MLQKLTVLYAASTHIIYSTAIQIGYDTILDHISHKTLILISLFRLCTVSPQSTSCNSTQNYIDYDITNTNNLTLQSLCLPKQH